MPILADYFPILVFLAIGGFIAVAMVGGSLLAARQKPYAEKLSSYECGFEPFDDARRKFDVRFYLVAILFIIFDLEVALVCIFVGHNFVLSVRNRSSQGFLGVRQRAEREPHLLRHGSSFVFYALMDAVVDRYFPIIDAMEGELDTIEEQIFHPGTARQNIERLYALKRRVGMVRHAVTPLMEACSKLYGGRVPQVCERSQDYFRDVYDHLARSNATLDALRDTIATAIQVNLSMVTIEESETTKRLAAWAGIFAVATFFVGVWGMNFERMPELKLPLGYPLALGVIASVCGVMYWRFRKSGWL